MTKAFKKQRTYLRDSSYNYGTFDADKLSNSPFTGIDIALIGTNLAILSETTDWGDYRGAKTPGLDPSELGSGWSGGNYASEGGQLPSARSFGLNVALKF